MKIITESEMNFGKYKEEDLFEIEKSEVLKSLGKGIKTVEFVLLWRDKNIIFLEAKKSCPNENNMHDTTQKERKFEEYYCSITQKFAESLQVYLAGVLNRYGEKAEIGSKFKDIRDYREKEILFVLVIKEADVTWLSGIKAILERRLLTLRKIWKIKVLVLNYELARMKGLISDM